MPTAFTPNNDGVNDFLYPLNGYKTADLVFRVFARSGQLVFESRSWTQKWDGKINGSPAMVGTYAWMLEYTDKNWGTGVPERGGNVIAITSAIALLRIAPHHRLSIVHQPVFQKAEIPVFGNNDMIDDLDIQHIAALLQLAGDADICPAGRGCRKRWLWNRKSLVAL